MKNRFIVVYTVFAAAVFIFALSFFGFNLYKEYSTNLEKSDTRYTNLVNDIRTISFNQPANNSSYAQSIKNAIGDAAAYSFIQVKRSGETVVFYPAGKVKEETVSKLTKSFTDSLTVNKQAISVDCNLYLIRPDSIFYYARVSFLMILIITIITVIMIIYLNIAEESASNVISLEEETDSYESEELDDLEERNDEEVEIETSPALSETEEITDTPVQNKDAAEKEQEENNSTEEALQEETKEESHANVTPEEVRAILAEPLSDEAVEDAIPVETTEVSQPAKLPVDEIKPAKVDEIPSGLFDPATGIGWESYLFTRLDNEIERATASEIDISLFIVKVPGIAMTSDVFKNICNYLAIQFQFKDLLFEYKDDSIVAIKISMNVDEALKLAEKLYNDICNIINDKNCRIGITSRSIRMVTAKRLMLEAEQSIEHSDDSAPIIAFRVDSEKYRQMIEQN